MGSELQSKKSLKITIIVSVILVGMASCAAIKFIHTANPLMSMTPQEKQEIKNKANKATIEYFKKEKNIDVTITDTEFSSELGGLKLFVNGYISNDKK